MAFYKFSVTEHFGGQITITDRVVNYPGIASISGAALTENMRQQAEAFGAEFKIAEVTALDMSGDIKTLHTTQGILSCFGVLLAAGARPRSAGFTGEEAFRGRGVAYCATCDGEFFRGKQVFVVGGGYAAAEESVFLTKYASHVTCLVRGDDFSCAKATADEARNHPDITVRTHTVVESVEGDALLRRLTCRDTETGETKTYDAGKDTFGVFVFAGYEPATELIRGIAELDPKGYVITDASMTLPSCWASTTRQGRDRPWTNHCARGCSTGIRLVTCASSSACPARSVQSSSQRLSALRP